MRPMMPKGINVLIHMKRFYWFLFPVLLLLLIFHPLFAAEPREAKQVLVLYSEDRDNPGQEMAEQGIRAGFRSNKPFDVQLYTEYLVWCLADSFNNPFGKSSLIAGN